MKNKFKKINLKELFFTLLMTITIFVAFKNQLDDSLNSNIQKLILSILFISLIYISIKKIVDLYKNNKKYLIILNIILYSILCLNYNILNLDFISKSIIFFLVTKPTIIKK